MEIWRDRILRCIFCWNLPIWPVDYFWILNIDNQAFCIRLQKKGGSRTENFVFSDLFCRSIVCNGFMGRVTFELLYFINIGRKQLSFDKTNVWKWCLGEIFWLRFNNFEAITNDDWGMEWYPMAICTEHTQDHDSQWVELIPNF